MSRKFVSRRDAVAFLFRIIANCKLDPKDEQIARDMIHCIEAELENYHEWGGDTSEAVILHFPPDSKQIQMMDRVFIKSTGLFLRSLIRKKRKRRSVI